MKDNVVLLVDDDSDALMINRKYLEGKGFTIYTCLNAEEAVEFLKSNKVDCIVLDVMMPGKDGFEAFPEIRALTEAPILYLSARGEAEDRVCGLALGADDYITKPCSLEEMALRLELHIRKSRPKQSADGEIGIPPLRILPLERKVFCGEEEVLLSNREYDMLLYFARNPGRTLTFEEIGTAVNGTWLPGDRQNVMMTVSRLRKKLETYGGASDLIATVWGEGYRLEVEG